MVALPRIIHGLTAITNAYSPRPMRRLKPSRHTPPPLHATIQPLSAAVRVVSAHIPAATILAPCAPATPTAVAGHAAPPPIRAVSHPKGPATRTKTIDSSRLGRHVVRHHIRVRGPDTNCLSWSRVARIGVDFAVEWTRSRLHESAVIRHGGCCRRSTATSTRHLLYF